MTDKISTILVRIATFAADVIQSSGKLKDIEENVDTINSAFKEITEGTAAQTADVNKVVIRTELAKEIAINVTITATKIILRTIAIAVLCFCNVTKDQWRVFP